MFHSHRFLLGNEFHDIVSSQVLVLLLRSFLAEITGPHVVLPLNMTRATLNHPHLQPEIFQQPFKKR
jgi:hypothetical protein